MKATTRPLAYSAAILISAVSLASSLHAEDATETGKIEVSAIVFQDGGEVGKVEAGQVVTILGMNDDTGEVLILFSNKEGKEVTGVVPGSAFVATTKEPAATPEPSPQSEE